MYYVKVFTPNPSLVGPSEDEKIYKFLNKDLINEKCFKILNISEAKN